VKKNKSFSWSQIQAWCACREKWRWAYEVGIVPKRVRRAPSVGSCGHAAIAAVLRAKDWKQAVDNWLKQEISKRAPLFDEERAELQEIADLVLAIIPRYLSQYQDSFEAVHVEHKFEIPVRGIRTRLVGYWDAIVRDKDDHLWLLEHKFPQTFRTEDNLDLDGQIGTYQYAANRLSYPIVGTIYNQLLARLPAVPKLNKDGSVSRAKIYTDWDTYRNFLVKRKLDPTDYSAEMELKLADFKFFQRNFIYRSPTETRLFARDMERRIWDMQSSRKHIYRSESFITCGSCSYRELCLESLKGGDIKYIIEDQFEPKKSREEELNARETEEESPNGINPGA
jgi:hypothetical protein